jgi:hypothetical protein
VQELLWVCRTTYSTVLVVGLQINLETLQSISCHNGHANHDAESLIRPDAVHERAIFPKELTDAGEDALK